MIRSSSCFDLHSPIALISSKNSVDKFIPPVAMVNDQLFRVLTISECVVCLVCMIYLIYATQYIRLPVIICCCCGLWIDFNGYIPTGTQWNLELDHIRPRTMTGSRKNDGRETDKTTELECTALRILPCTDE